MLFLFRLIFRIQRKIFRVRRILNKYLRLFFRGNTILVLFLAILVIGFLPFFTLLCNEILLYSVPVILLLTYVSRCVMRSVAVHDEHELHEFLIQCVKLSVWKMLRHVYSYKYCMLVHTLVYDVLSYYIHLLVGGQNTMRVTQQQLCRAFSYRRYKHARLAL